MNIPGALDRPTSSEIYINGIDTIKISEKELFNIWQAEIRFIFQRFYLVPNLNALDNILIPLIHIRITENNTYRAKELLKEVDLSDRMFHIPNEISGSQVQRITIAKSSIMSPKIILANGSTGEFKQYYGSRNF